jgi:hypothetical protein
MGDEEKPKSIMVPKILKFTLFFLLAYGLSVFLVSKVPGADSIYTLIRNSVGGVVGIALPSAQIESQVFSDPATGKSDVSAMYLVYGNPVLMKKTMEEALASGVTQVTLPTRSISFRLFEMFMVPLLFLVSIFIATPMNHKHRWMGLIWTLLILFVFLLIRCVVISLFSISNDRIGVYELEDSSMKFLQTVISIFSLGFSMSLAFVLWLIFGFRHSVFIDMLQNIFKNQSK